MPTNQQLELLRTDDRDLLRERARAMRRAGATQSQIKAATGITSTYRIQSWVKDIPPANPRRRVRAKDEVRAQARELRRLGRTYTEIAAELGVSKSSCSLWCDDMPRPKPRPGRRRPSTWLPYLRRRATARANAKLQAAYAIGRLSERELFLIGVTLYICEGSKAKPWRRDEVVAFVNSDPRVIEVFIAWLDLLGVERKDHRYTVQIHESADIRAATVFWMNLVQASPEQMYKINLKRHNPRTVRGNTGENYHGCLRINVLKGAELYWRIEGWWLGIAEGVEEAGRVNAWKDESNDPGSFKGRTRSFGLLHRGSNPRPGAQFQGPNLRGFRPWLRVATSRQQTLGLPEPLSLHRQRVRCGQTAYPQGAAASPPRRPVEPGAPPP